MSITIHAHQLRLLIDKTAGHMADEDTEELHGIRFDVDSRYLYAVATDRYTLAAARYLLNRGEQDQEPWARTVPAGFVPALSEWLESMKGSAVISITVAGDRLVFDGPRTELTVAATPGLEFPDWRGLLRRIVAQTVEGDPFPSINTAYLTRWAVTEHSLRTRVTADRKAVLFFGEDFIGAQMPNGGGGIGPAKEQTFEAAHSQWLWTLAAGAPGVDMANLPEPEPSRYEASRDIRETASYLLRGVMTSTSDSFDTEYFDGDQRALLAHIHYGVSSWMAFRYLDVLAQVDPRAAQRVVDETAEQLDSGELGEWAWDMAAESGFNPKQWQDDYEARVAKQNAEEPRLWAVRLARSLNAAKDAGISMQVAGNEFVALDMKTGEWKPVAPQSTSTTP